MTRSTNLAFVLVLAAALVPASVPHALAADALHVVSGVVVSDSGAPLPGAVVYGYVATPDGSSSTSDKTTVGEDGRFTLHLGDGAGNLNVYYEKWPQSYVDHELKVSGSNVTGLKLVLAAPPPKTALLQGTVLDANGKPVEGATVQLGYGCCIMYAKGGAPSGAPVMMTPTVATTTAPAPTQNATASSPSDAPANDSATPAPSSMPVRCCCCNYNDQDSAVTGVDGKFSLSSYGGPHSLTASAKGYAQTTVQVETKDNATVTQDVKLLKVPPADASVDGRVLDAKTGLPIANAGVSLNNLEWSRYLFATTGADGRFHFDALPGWSEIDVYVQRGGEPTVSVDGVGTTSETSAKSLPPSDIPARTYYAYARTLAIVSGKNQVDAKLQPRADANVILLGYVVDPTTKKGVEGANVNVWDQDAGDWGSATTDATGSYKILVRPGHFTMNANAPGHLNGALTFVMAASETTKRIDIEIPAGETRHAGCGPEADCRGAPAPMMAYPMDAKSGAPPGASRAVAAPTQPASSASAPTASANGPSAGPDSTRAAVFMGSGGGLPPYDANAPASRAAANGGTDGTATGGGSGPKNVGLVGITLVLGIVGAIALATRRGRDS